MSGIKFFIRQSFILVVVYQLLVISCLAKNIKESNSAGSFYPDNPKELSRVIDRLLEAVSPASVEGRIFALILPHAGLEFSGDTAAFGYKSIKGEDYNTVVLIAPSHYHRFSGVSVYPQGAFRTPLGDLAVDEEIAHKLMAYNKEVLFLPEAFAREHSLEVQLPFLQRVSPNSRIVPIIIGDISLDSCKRLAAALKKAISGRQDILVIASTDMYHGYDYEEAEAVDSRTLSYLSRMDAEEIYRGLKEGKLQLCGGLPVVVAILLVKDMGSDKLITLKYTNSAQVTGKKEKGAWTVGYASCAIYGLKPKANEGSGVLMNKGAVDMLNKIQRKRLLEIARSSIELYLREGRKATIKEEDEALKIQTGAFVTLHKNGQLRGCIGNLIARQPLYLTIRDMAIEAATADPRFSPLEPGESKDIEIEISVLSPLLRVGSAQEIELGKHGVLIRKGFQSGVFLPQVALETGWSKEEFLSVLCEQKAGLAPDAWKDKSTEIYIFTAEVFSEKN
ncbi:MAG: AmmeMemoRadiSam system protein B [Candidatus Omnitrophota bacterium]